MQRQLAARFDGEVAGGAVADSFSVISGSGQRWSSGGRRRRIHQKEKPPARPDPPPGPTLGQDLRKSAQTKTRAIDQFSVKIPSESTPEGGLKSPLYVATDTGATYRPVTKRAMMTMVTTCIVPCTPTAKKKLRIIRLILARSGSGRRNSMQTRRLVGSR